MLMRTKLPTREKGRKRGAGEGVKAEEEHTVSVEIKEDKKGGERGKKRRRRKSTR